MTRRVPKWWVVRFSSLKVESQVRARGRRRRRRARRRRGEGRASK